MKIILNNDVLHLGEEGDVVVVKDGYARNYLLPTKQAVIYNKANAAQFAQRAEAIAKRKEEKRAAATSLKEKLDNVVLTMVVAAGDSGKLFGSVTSTMVQEALAKEGFEVERKKLDVPSHLIKMTGTYTATVHLYENNLSTIKINVVSEAQMKAAQKKAAEEAAAAAKAAEEAAKAEEATEAPVEG